MRKTTCKLGVVFLLIVGGAASARAQTTPKGLDPGQVASILGSPAPNWKVPEGFVLRKLDGRPVLTVNEGAPVIQSTRDYGANFEYSLTFRLNAAAANGQHMHFQVADVEPATAIEHLPGAAIYGNTADNSLNWYVFNAKGTKNYVATGNYSVKGITQRSLAWPETLRKRVEADNAALPPVSSRWFTLRVAVRPGQVDTWLDDRFMGRRNEPGLNVKGKLRFTVSPQFSIAKLSITPITETNSLYLTLPLQGHTNSQTFNGQRNLIREKIVTAGSSPDITLSKIPFVLPSASNQGNDHIAVAKSWAQFTGLEGNFDSYGGELDFNGRWPGAFTLNQTRIQLRVPYDSYNKLHLIAASDDSPNSVPIVTAQFYRENAGHPESFSARVPKFSQRAEKVTALPVKLSNGKSGSLYLVTIPLDPARLANLKLEDYMSIELTKQVRLFRGYPDPATFSYHHAGLPSSVHIYAATLERAPVQIEFAPAKFAGVWTAPAMPSYNVTLRNRTGSSRTVSLELGAMSEDRGGHTVQRKSVVVGAGQSATVKIPLSGLKKYGYHDVTLKAVDGQQSWTWRKSLAYLHPETRSKGNWDHGKGPSLGYWGWGGGHDTPLQLQEMEVMAAAGAETSLHPFEAKEVPQAVKDFARRNGMRTYDMFGAGAAYATTFTDPPMKEKFEAGDYDAAGATLVEELRKLLPKNSDVHRGEFVTFFPEPGLGPISYGSLPEYWGDPERKLTPAEQKNFDYFLKRFLTAGRAIRKTWPDAKLLLPYGDPLFVVPFLRYSPEARELIDGSALDMPAFERMPESQVHQVQHQRLYQLVNEYRKVGKTPYLVMVEGPCSNTTVGALDWEEQANNYTRAYLLYFAYGVYLHPSGPTPFDCANYWGEQHYGSCGLFSRLPMADPKPAYVGYATLTRHLNRSNFTKWLPTGSLSVNCLQYKNVNDGHLTHALYTIRGKRNVTLTAPAGARVTYYDRNDNPVVLPVRDGRVSFTLTPSPCYIEGLTSDPKVALGAPDHSDARPAAVRTRLGNPGDGSWKISTQRDTTYENNNPLQIDRAVGNMSIQQVMAPAAQGTWAAAVHLGKQAKVRQIMPWYTTLVPSHPLPIPGKASHLGLWVKGASDWGRVVYSVRDAKGQRWLSVGTTDSWNCDDTKTLSFFNFDGWRYLRFELPAMSGYDNFIEAGTTWWGHHGGDGIVHLPLKLEKIIVERRTHAMYVNQPQPTNPADVLLGDIFAEYAGAFDKTEAAVKQSQIRMPLPEGVPNLGNPIAAMVKSGVGAPAAITSVDAPPREADGTRCLVNFSLVTGATSYDIWVSPYANGTGALKMASDWKESGQPLTGLRPDIDFYLFLVYTDKDGKPSKPSAPFKIRLKDMFAMK